MIGTGVARPTLGAVLEDRGRVKCIQRWSRGRLAAQRAHGVRVSLEGS